MLGIFLDTETSGLNPRKHVVLEICYRILDLSSSSEKAYFHAVVKWDKKTFSSADPSSLKVNGFTFDEVKKGVELQEVKAAIVSSFQSLNIQRSKAVFICQNPSFDRAFFSQIVDTDEQEEKKWPYHWLDLASMYWASSLKAQKLPWETGISKDQIAKALSLKEEAIPHRAENGVNHLISCYTKLVGFPKNSHCLN